MPPREPYKQGQPTPLATSPAVWPAKAEPVAFQGPAGRLVRALEPHTEADPVAVLIQALVAFGNCIGRTAHFEVEADRHYCNLFAVLVGATAKGRKGVSLGLVKRVVAGADAEWAARCVRFGLSSGEGILHAVRNAQGKDDGVDEKRVLAVELEFATPASPLRGTLG